MGPIQVNIVEEGIWIVLRATYVGVAGYILIIYI